MDLPCGFHKLTCFSLRRRTVLHAGENEIIVRDRVPAPLPGDLRDSLCGDSEDVHPFKRRPCPHELWLALDLDGRGNGDRDGDRGRDDENLGWKTYHRFTLRVSWPASVSDPLILTHIHHSLSNLRIWKHALTHTSHQQHPAQVALSLHSPALPSAPSSARRARVHFARIRLTQEGIRVPNHHAGIGLGPETWYGEGSGGEAVPLVVILEPLVLGMLPSSVVPTAATVLCVLGVLVYGVLPCILTRLGSVVESARGELAALEERKEKSS